MSTRVHSNIAVGLSRQLGLGYNTAGTARGGASKAIPIVSPNSLPNPGPADAMGIAGKVGVVSFVTEQVGQTYTVYEYSALAAKASNGANPWVLAGGNSSQYSFTTDAAYAKVTFTISENALYFISASTTPCAVCLIGGGIQYNGNPIADITPV